LHIASHNGHASVCDVLLRNGAAVNQANKNGTTPLHIASQNGHASVCDLLLRNGAAVNQVDNAGRPPLHVASYNGHASVCDLLLSHGAAVNQADNDGHTPLHIASHNGHASVCDLLLSHGAQVNQVAHDGRTPLHVASQKGHASVCDVLLARYPSVLIIPLLYLPTDLIPQILAHLSLDELFIFLRYTFSISRSQQKLAVSSPSSSSLNPIISISALLQVFRQHGDQLFHRFQLSPSYLNRLRRISVRVTSLQMRDFDGESLRYLEAHKDSVKELDFSSSRNLTDQYLTQLGLCPCLTSLSLAHCTKITDSGLLTFLESNPQLVRLNLSSTPQLTQQMIGRLGACCPNLQHLDVSRNSWFGQSSLMLLVDSLPELKSLNISHSSIPTPSMIEFLQAKPRLQSISLVYDGITPPRARPLSMTVGDDGGRDLLVQLALRSVMYGDIESQKLGFSNLHLLLQGDNGTLYEMVRSRGALTHIVQRLSHLVGLSSFSSSPFAHSLHVLVLCLTLLCCAVGSFGVCPPTVLRDEL
jgi:hypothetical protein